MDANNDSARTMRIDISPTTCTQTTALSKAVTTSPAARETLSRYRAERPNRDTSFDKLLESIYDAVFITTRDGTISDFNLRAAEIFAAIPAKFVGSSILNLISGANPNLIEAIDRNLGDQKYTIIEARCTRFNATSFQAEIAVNMINLDGRGQLCFLIRDISARHKAQQQLQHALERMEALGRARMEFVSNVSHELRTPLTSMIYAVKNMQRGVAGVLPERAMQYLARLDSDCQRLLGTVNDILDLRQIENKTITLIKTCVPFARLAENAIDSLRVQTDEKNITMLLCKSQSANFVYCDARKMERVILNVVGNAIKFTPADGSIRIAVEPSQSDPQLLEMTVDDTGVGIQPENLPKLTTRYFQVGEPASGSGLGLAITRELVELHGGKLSIESPVPGSDSGTRVRITLPLTTAPKILAVCDNSECVRTIQRIAATLGTNITSFASAHAVIKSCKREIPDMLILGNSTCDLPPSDLIIQLRNDRRTSRIPMLMLTCTAEPPEIQQLITAFRLPTASLKQPDQEIATLILDTILAKGKRI